MHEKNTNDKEKKLKNIGAVYYEFIYAKEKAIYSYLCSMRLKKKTIRKLGDELIFNTYSDWKQYICNKYEKYSDKRLREFSRYLNQLIRNLKPDREYERIVIPILLTIIVTALIEYMSNLKFPELTGMVVQEIIILVIIFIILILILWSPILFFVYKLVSPIWDHDVDENFLKDYKEIIDEMIEERKEKGA